MGKIRNQRKKFHASKAGSNPTLSSDIKHQSNRSDLPIKPSENMFENVNINISKLKTNLSDDACSVRSFKSIKSESGKVMPKKDKVRLRREMLLNTLREKQPEQQPKKKKKKRPLVDDMNSLRDALPSLDGLLKSKGNVSYQQKQESKKRKGIEKTRIAKKNYMQGMKMFQYILKNKQYQKDPRQLVSQNVNYVVQRESS